MDPRARTRDAARPAARSLLAVAGCLVAYLAVGYQGAFGLPFLSDDYVFLDKVARTPFLDLWRPRELAFGWYRPWSREFHYWVLYKLAGVHEAAFHALSFVLFLAILLLYHELVRRFSGRRSTAAIATAGLAALALWGGPLLWIAGAQDLWMLFFSLCFLHALARGWMGRAYVALLLALLSKETAAVLPGVAFGYLLWVEHLRLRAATVRAAGFAALVLAWAILHPTLSARLFGPLRHSIETVTRLSPAAAFARTLLAQVNLDAIPAPDAHWGSLLPRALAGAAALVTMVLLATRSHESRSERERAGPPAWNLVLFGLSWALLGWGILLLPSIGWHAYYGSLGTLGCWLALGVLLERHRRTAFAVIAALAVLCQVRAATPSWDWGTYWYQKRAGSFLDVVRNRLFELHPTFPAHSRLYFATLPNNIGFLGGDGPAIRVWYHDPTLRAYFLSAYALRAPTDSTGRDYFFRFDLYERLVELNAGPESTFSADRFTAAWRHDENVLASEFLQAGNVAGAAQVYAKLWAAFPIHPNYALYAAAAYEAAGDSVAARAWYRTAAGALGDSTVRARAPAFVRQAREFLEAGTRRAVAPG